MPKPITLLAITLLFMATGAAQEKKQSTCRFRFAVAEGIGLDGWGVWPEDARRWWNKEGKGKFPELCEAIPPDADFVIAWGRKQTTVTHHVPKWESMQTYGRIQAEADCYPGVNGETYCPLAPRITPLDWEDQQWEVERISVTVCRVHKDQFSGVASLTKAGYFPKDQPGRASFKSAMKALKKKATQPWQLRTSGICAPEITGKGKRPQTQRTEQRFPNP